MFIGEYSQPLISSAVQFDEHLDETHAGRDPISYSHKALQALGFGISSVEHATQFVPVNIRQSQACRRRDSNRI